MTSGGRWGANKNVLGDIQGNILRGYGKRLPWVVYLFAAVDRDAEPERVRRFFAGQAAEVADGRPWGSPGPARRLGMAFTYPGLQALGIGPEPFEPFTDFCEGMRARAAMQLRDADESDPRRWPPELATEAHVLMTLYAADRADCERWCQTLSDGMRQAGLTVVWVQRAMASADGREAFGFVDGFSQPVVAGAARESGEGPPPVTGEGAQRPVLDGLFPRLRDPVTLWRGVRGDWRELRLGEFVLGHQDEDGVVPGGDHPVLRNGTFMVWRKLEQDIDAFEAWAAQQAAEPGEVEALKAWVVGRTRDGTSLMHGDAPGPPATAHAADPGDALPPDNTFLYAGDPDGRRCPLGAHVRRAHPRDGLGARTERTRRNRIIRRGVPYEEDGKRGLIFVCFNASINRQFEQIQGHWLASGDPFGLGAQPDFLTGGMGGQPWVTMTVPRGEDPSVRPTRFLRRDRPFVTVRGGYYLFVPGIRALGAMFDSTLPAQSPASRA